MGKRSLIGLLLITVPLMGLDAGKAPSAWVTVRRGFIWSHPTYSTSPLILGHYDCRHDLFSHFAAV